MTLENLMKMSGQFTSLEWERKAKTRKAFNEENIRKATKAHNIRIGASYDGMKSVQERKGVENKEQAQAINQGLNGLEWVKFPVLLQNPKTGKQYVRIELTKNSKFNSEFYVNGTKTKKENIKEKLLSSEFSKGNMPEIMNIPLENIK